MNVKKIEPQGPNWTREGYKKWAKKKFQIGKIYKLPIEADERKEGSKIRKMELVTISKNFCVFRELLGGAVRSFTFQDLYVLGN